MSPIDKIEHEYRRRSQPSFYKEETHVGTTVDAPSSYSRPVYDEQIHVTETTVDASKPLPTYHQETKVVEETVEYPRSYHSTPQKSRMGYYDEDGKLPSSDVT